MRQKLLFLLQFCSFHVSFLRILWFILRFITLKTNIAILESHFVLQEMYIAEYLLIASVLHQALLER